jgi:hypothetical protein
MQLNMAQQEKGQAAFANPRNAAAGSIRLLDPAEASQRRLSFLAFQLVMPEVHNDIVCPCGCSMSIFPLLCLVLAVWLSESTSIQQSLHEKMMSEADVRS